MKIILLFVLLVSFIHSSPAFSKTRVYIQKDGSTFNGIAIGDEYLNYIKSFNGEILKYNKSLNSYTYAVVNQNNLIASDEIYSKNLKNKYAPAFRTNLLNRLKEIHAYNKKNRLLGI